MSQTIGFPVDFSKMLLLQRTKIGLQETFGKRKPDSRLPVTYNMLTVWSSLIDWNNFDHLVLFTMLVVAFFGLLRTSEFAADNKKVRYSDQSVYSYKALWMVNLNYDISNNKINYYNIKICASKGRHI